MLRKWNRRKSIRIL